MAIALSTMLWGGTLRAGEKEVFEPGTGKYILVLVNPNTDTADPKTKKKPKEPDVAKHGGKLLYKLKECRVIKLPVAAAKALRKEENVAFLQRVWLGESLEGWEESEVPSTESFLKAPVESDATDLTWTTGTYTYDGSGNIKAIGGDTYRYDTAGRLSQTTFHGVVETYKYDSFGNLTERAPAGQPNVIRVESSSNRLTGESYDAAGNVTTRGLKDAYSYDSLNQMDQIVTPLNADRRMIYGPDEERIGVIVDTQLARWKIRDFDGRVLREFKDMGSDVWQWEEDYVYEEGRLVGGDRDPYFGGARHFHTDHLGSVRMITDHEGMRIGVHDYYPFGQEQTSVIQNWTLSPELREEAAKFTGHERDYNGLLNWENTDYIDYMHARYYDPGVGRFLSVDPVLDIEKALREPQRWNRYSYVINSPLRYADRDGRETNPVSGQSYIEDDQLRTNSSNPRIGMYGNTRSANNWKGGRHDGVDIAAKKGTPLVAPVSGMAIVLKNHPKGGNVVFIDTKRDGKTIRIGMAHMTTVTIKEGDKVKEGQPVGTSGDTGNAKGLPVAEQHVHLSVKVNGEYVDPQKHFQDNPSKIERK